MKTTNTPTRFYCYGDGRVWRIPVSVIRSATTYDEIMDGCRMLAVRCNNCTGTWPTSRLPGGIYAGDAMALFSASNNAAIVSLDDLVNMVDYWRITASPRGCATTISAAEAERAAWAL